MGHSVLRILRRRGLWKAIDDALQRLACPGEISGVLNAKISQQVEPTNGLFRRHIWLREQALQFIRSQVTSLVMRRVCQRQSLPGLAVLRVLFQVPESFGSCRRRVLRRWMRRRRFLKYSDILLVLSQLDAMRLVLVGQHFR